MAIIPQKDQDALKQILDSEIHNDVYLTLFTSDATMLSVPGRECPTCPETQQLMEEVVALSDKLHLRTVDFYVEAGEVQSYGIERIPAIVVEQDGQHNVRYFGIPSGYEFTTLLEDLIFTSRGASPLPEDVREAVRKIDQEVHIQVFVTPS